MMVVKVNHIYITGGPTILVIAPDVNCEGGYGLRRALTSRPLPSESRDHLIYGGTFQKCMAEAARIIQDETGDES